MTDPAPTDPTQAALAQLSLLDEEQRKLIERMWARPSSKPLLKGPAVVRVGLKLEEMGLALFEAGSGGQDVIVLTEAGMAVARAARGIEAGEATPAPRPKPALTLMSSAIDVPVTRDDATTAGASSKRDKPERQTGEIYPGCPVQALGVHGKLFFYLDVLGQLQPVDNHTKDKMRALFGGRIDFLMAQWPSWSKGEDAKVIGWKQEDAAAAMQRACTEKGVWNAFERVRGLGAWPDPDGGVALHCGDAILYRGKWEPPGELEGYVYPSAPKIPRPLDDVSKGASAASDLLSCLDTWQWLRGDLDAYLLMGWIVGAMFGGAIDWRPLIWITGDKGTGKSTVQKLIRHVMGGEGAILQSTDATEASIRQMLMMSTIPVALDELEADADNRRSLAVIKLARQASSGGVVLRGGADHTGQEFRARSAFAFSSILVPPLLDQDISRIALLELMPLARGEVSPSIEPRKWANVGRALRAQVLSQWDRLHDTLELYRQALSAAGHDARGQDQFGTLLAMADLAMHLARPDQARCNQWAQKLSAETIGEQTDQSSDWQRMLNHLLGQHLDIYRGGDRHTLGRWILAAAGLLEHPDPIKAQQALPAYGLRIEGRGETARLTIANNHPGLAALFLGTHWHAGGGQKGVWAQAAKRIPGAMPTEKVARFDGVVARGYHFSLTAVPNFFEERTAEPPAASTDNPAQTYNPEDFV